MNREFPQAGEVVEPATTYHSSKMGSEFASACYRRACSLRDAVIGLGVLLILWYVGTKAIELDPQLESFADFGPISTFRAIGSLWNSGVLVDAFSVSSYRLFSGLGIAIGIGIPVGIVLGASRHFREVMNSPFQLLRMVSPIAWEPIAVMVFATWNDTIIFLIAMAAVWPVMFATSAGLDKVDPAWFKVARNLGAKPRHMLTQIILPAIAFDVFTGIRLALGVAWIVLVPAEMFGVSSGLGYTIKDARA
ncbi:MAG TPA: ABC transporter permease subunit, partial [Gammaproteobacteria bacterium]|nr:ABC transporter permease subunit [Gammaproteobacteria bacterium]